MMINPLKTVLYIPGFKGKEIVIRTIYTFLVFIYLPCASRHGYLS